MACIRDRLNAVQGRIDKAEAALAKTKRTGHRLDALRELLAKLQAEKAGILEEQRILIESCRKAVYHQALKFVRANPMLSRDDLISAGFVGLTLAAQLFEPERGLEFSTYAITCIWAHVVLEAKTDRLVAVPGHYHVGLRARREGREPPRPMPYLDDAEQAMRPIRSLDTWGVDNDDDRSPLETMAVKESEPPPYGPDELERLREALTHLPERERRILLDRMHGRSLLEIGADHGISKERVRQVQMLATERLKEMLLPGYTMPRRVRTPRQCRRCQHTQTQHEVGGARCRQCGTRFRATAQSA